MSPASYLLWLPPQWKIHPVFHIDLLTPYRKTTTHGDNYLCPPLEIIDNEEEYEVKAILDSRTFGRGCKLQYLVKWKGYPESKNQWEDTNNVHSNDLVCQFQRRHPTKKMHLRMGFHPCLLTCLLLTLSHLNLTLPQYLLSVQLQKLDVCSLFQNQDGYPQTAPRLCRLTWTQELRLREAMMTREVSQWAQE